MKKLMRIAASAMLMMATLCVFDAQAQKPTPEVIAKNTSLRMKKVMELDAAKTKEVYGIVYKYAKIKPSASQTKQDISKARFAELKKVITDDQMAAWQAYNKKMAAQKK